jgi:hypothetical protein
MNRVRILESIIEKDLVRLLGAARAALPFPLVAHVPLAAQKGAPPSRESLPFSTFLYFFRHSAPLPPLLLSVG